MSLFLSKKTRMRITGVMVNVFAMVKSRFGARRRRSIRQSVRQRPSVQPFRSTLQPRKWRECTEKLFSNHHSTTKAETKEEIINQEDEELTYECGMTSINETPVRFFQISCVRNIRRARRRSDEGAVSVLIDSCM